VKDNPQRPDKQGLGRRRQMTVLGLTAPAYLWLALTIFLPLSAMLFFSFLTVAPLNGRHADATLQNYLDFFQKGFYLTLTGRSLMLGVYVTGFCVVLGFPAALALAKFVKGRWREALFLMVVLPFWSNALVRTFSWTMVLRSDGLIDRGVQDVFPGAPHLDILFSYPAVVIGLVHSFLPYMILTCYISLQAIDDSLLEAARSLGAPTFTVFRRVLLPLSAPGLVAGSILIFVPVIGSFMEALSFVLLGIVLLILAVCYPLLRRHLQGAA
jgi:spermidine/putrescine transport system permease protein